MANNKKNRIIASSVTAALVASAIAPVAGAAFTDSIPTYAKSSVEYVNSKGYMNGLGGTTEFGAAKNITRAEVAVLIAKALNLQTQGKTADFADVPATHWASGSIAAVVEAGIAKGTGEGFNPAGQITRQEAAVMFANAYKELKLNDQAKVSFNDESSIASWAKKQVEVLASLGIFGGKTGGVFAPTDLITRGEIAVLVHRAEVPEQRLEVPTTGAVKVESVSAINAKTLEVKFNTAVDSKKANIVVKRGTASPTVKAITFSEDKTSATIEFTTAMIAGDYTVTVSGLTEEALTGTTKVEAEKLTSIDFLSDIAVISGNNITTTVVAKNQYGETINTKLNTSSNSNIKGTGSKGTNVTIDSKGLLTVEGTSNLFNVDDKVVVTVVDSNTGVSVSKTLTVAKSAIVNSITVGEIKTDNEELAKKTLNLANYSGNESKFYIPVEVKDQYGNILDATALNNALTVTSSNTKIVKLATTKFVDTKDGVVLKFQASDSTATHGTVVLTFVAASTGKTATTSVTIKENAKLDVVTLEANSLVQGIATELPISMTNTYGEQVNLFDVTVGGTNSSSITLDTDTTITATNATLTVERDYINKTAKLKVTPTAKNVIIQVTSATGKPQVLTLTAENAPTVSAIKGLNKDFVTLFANDATLKADLKTAVEFVDQYGNDIAAPNFDANDGTAALDFTIKEKDSANTVTTLSNGEVSASTTAGTEVYEVILKDANGNELDKLEVTFSVVDADKLTQFEIGDLNKFYTGAVSTAHNQTVEVFGVSNGKKVMINQAMIQDVYASNGLTGFTGAQFEAKAIVTDGKDVASTLTVLVANTNNTYTITKEVTYSDAAPVAQSLVAKYDDKVVTGAVQVPYAELNKGFTPDSVSASKLQFIAKDQYGVQISKNNFNFVATNNGTTSGAVTEQGQGSSFAAGDAGKSLLLNVRVDGISTSIKVIAQ